LEIGGGAERLDDAVLEERLFPTACLRNESESVNGGAVCPLREGPAELERFWDDEYRAAMASFDLDILPPILAEEGAVFIEGLAGVSGSPSRSMISSCKGNLFAPAPCAARREKNDAQDALLSMASAEMGL
jgi:hypothetical protein